MLGEKMVKKKNTKRLPLKATGIGMYGQVMKIAGSL